MPVADDALAAGIGDYRRLQFLGDGEQFGAGLGAAAADIDHRLFGGGEQRGGLVDQLRVGRRRRGRCLDLRQRHLALQRHDVERHLERHRPRPAVASWRKASLTSLPASLGWLMRSAHFVRPRRIASWSGISCNRPKPRPIRLDGICPRDAQHRRIGRIGGGERRCGVEQPRPRHDGEGAGLAARPRIAERHVGGGLLVARVDHPDLLAGIVQRDEQRVVLYPGQGEQRVDPVPGQHLDQCPAARHPRHSDLPISCRSAVNRSIQASKKLPR